MRYQKGRASGFHPEGTQPGPQSCECGEGGRGVGSSGAGSKRSSSWQKGEQAKGRVPTLKTKAGALGSLLTVLPHPTPNT